MSKGRYVPPPSAQQQRAQAVLDQLTGQIGVFVLETRHDNACPTIRTQNAADCVYQTVEQDLIKLWGPKQ